MIDQTEHAVRYFGIRESGMAGLTSPADMQSKSFVPALYGKPPARGEVDYCFLSNGGDPMTLAVMRAIRTHDFKYVFKACDIDELYDPRDDPAEIWNLGSCAQANASPPKPAKRPPQSLPHRRSFSTTPRNNSERKGKVLNHVIPVFWAGVCLLAAVAPGAPPSASIPPLSRAVVLDGRLGGEEWRDAAVVRFLATDDPAESESAVPGPVATTCHLKYDDRALWVGWSCR